MAEKEKNNNLLYTILVVVGLLLIMIPFFLFDIGGSSTILTHIGRFGLHILAFGSAIIAGSIASGAITKAGSSALTVKVAAISSAVIIGGGLTYNIIQNTYPNSSVLITTTSNDSSLIATNNLKTEIVDTAATSTDSSSSFVVTSPEDTITSALSSKKNTPAKTTNLPNQKEISKNNASIIPNKTTTEELRDACNSFQVMQGSKPLNRQLGISIYDPNKMIQFKNDCGCLLKDANISLTREGKVIEQRTQNGNYINWRTFKGISPDDKLEIDIKQANCNDSKGSKFLYAFPKPILTIIYISYHMQFEGAEVDKTKTNNNKEIKKTTPTKIAPKDKVEEELNKYSN